LTGIAVQFVPSTVPDTSMVKLKVPRKSSAKLDAPSESMMTSALTAPIVPVMNRFSGVEIAGRVIAGLFH
jgi:hypothetical protein